MGHLYEAITSYMDEADRHYQVDIEGGLIVTEITGDHGSWHVFIQITDDDEVHSRSRSTHLFKMGHGVKSSQKSPSSPPWR